MGPLSATDFHVLMVLAEGPSYGYAIMKAVDEHSGGAVSLSRVVALAGERDLLPEGGTT